MTPVSTELALKYSQLGPCLKPGSEVWWIERKRLRVATVISIDEAKDEIRVRSSGTRPDDNKPMILRPMDTLIIAAKPKGLK